MKNKAKIPHCRNYFPNVNRKITRTEAKSIHLTHTYMTVHFVSCLVQAFQYKVSGLNSIIIAYRFDRICNIHELDVDLTNEAENKSEAIYCIDNFVLIVLSFF